MNKSRGQLEAEISTAVTKFEKEYLGRGPKESKTYIFDDIIVIRLKGVLTPAEEKLALEEGGAQMIKQMRTRLIESTQRILIGIISEMIDVEIESMLTDINPRTGERVFFISVAEKLF